MKASDKQDLCRKMISLLKPRYGSGSKKSLPVLETMLFSVCLEGVPPAQAEETYQRLLAEFQDLNEIRVSSIYELERLFSEYPDPDLRGLRIKNILHYVFEKTYSFEFEVLRRRTQEQALKDLGKIRSLSPFCRAYTQQNSLDTHVLPIDEKQAQVLRYMGVVEPNCTVDHASEALRPFVRKADALLFSHLLRSVATDPDFSPTFAELPDEEDDHSPIERLQGVLSGARKAKKKPRDEKPADRKPTAKPAASSKAAPSKPATRPAASKKPVPPRSAKPASKKK